MPRLYPNDEPLRPISDPVGYQNSCIDGIVEQVVNNEITLEIAESYLNAEGRRDFHVRLAQRWSSLPASRRRAITRELPNPYLDRNLVQVVANNVFREMLSMQQVGSLYGIQMAEAVWREVVRLNGQRRDSEQYATWQTRTLTPPDISRFQSQSSVVRRRERRIPA